MPSVVGLIQQNNSGLAGVASGAATSIGANPAPNNTVLLSVASTAANDTVSNVSGLGATWTSIVNSVASTGGGANQYFYMGRGCTGGSSTVTVTTTGANTYNFWAAELAGAGEAISAGTAGGGAATGTSFSLTANPPLEGGGFVAVFLAAFTPSFLSSPTSPWSKYTGGWVIDSNGASIVTQSTIDSTPVTATWTSSSVEYSMCGIVILPIGFNYVAPFPSAGKGATL